ncbi:hypothetical protein [Prosthecobacter sp.]|uniref:hypothetical protein n=1 Tax=Prosthecobacter sp. TaxID=1965333 RepID=UPI002AB7FE11|nr:hypothetical protein [Prosthecobacter sp.]MDZ4404108.1 hypothetical protein [Prosthecobacter sp.]
MKRQTHPGNTTLTLGEFIMHVYDACTAPKAGAVVRFALKTQRVMWRGNPPHASQPRRSTRSPGRAVRPKPVASRFHG